MYIIVTGASGFLGKRLIESLLKNKKKIIAISRVKKSIPKKFILNKNIIWIVCNLEKKKFHIPENFKISAAFHLAGTNSGKNLSQRGFLDKNVLTTRNFLKSIKNRTDRIIYTSSQVVYGNPNCLNVMEDFPLDANISNYSMSKIKGEELINNYQKRYNNMSILFRMSGFIEGGGIVDYIIDCALKNKKISLFSKGKVNRDYLPLENAIEIFLKCLDIKKKKGSHIFNLGPGITISSHEMAKFICKTLGSKSRIELSNKNAQIQNFSMNTKKLQKRFKVKSPNLIQKIKKYTILKKYEKENKHC
tara:strand:- start:21 stop:932 length:912 start_codon:yes stop_codon:yes gene_type:complete